LGIVIATLGVLRACAPSGLVVWRRQEPQGVGTRSLWGEADGCVTNDRFCPDSAIRRTLHKLLHSRPWWSVTCLRAMGTRLSAMNSLGCGEEEAPCKLRAPSKFIHRRFGPIVRETFQSRKNIQRSPAYLSKRRPARPHTSLQGAKNTFAMWPPFQARVMFWQRFLA